MTALLRIILIIASLACAVWILVNIRKAKVRIEDSVFWIFFSLMLIILSLFPVIVEWGARITGIYSPQNFLFLAIIFIIIVKLFRMTIRVSQMDSKMQQMAERIAIDQKERREKETDAK